MVQFATISPGQPTLRACALATQMEKFAVAISLGKCVYNLEICENFCFPCQNVLAAIYVLMQNFMKEVEEAINTGANKRLYICDRNLYSFLASPPAAVHS